MRVALYVLLGFFSGSVMYSRLLPLHLCGIDIVAASDDGNPGTANVFKHAGVGLGVCCLLLDMGKGFLPVYLARRALAIDALPFAAVIAAPVAGHAFSPFLKGEGGKAIAASFGALLALLPHSYAVFVLAVYYLFFSLVVIIRPNHRRSIVTYGLFCATMLCMGASPGVSLGCMLISLIVIDRHLHARLAARRAAAQTD
ncbi:glycerol-3-phosphate acyltransferase [Feifania hominis]|uniref:Glycerol-3-phosphate acyltransferase n=1 Tax=Feifania hominis TaxID=2763660 RepID=A0A926HVC2_9FIRM|nr:glycerol-3-phosphate acyltransferase [Feifania hominis]MBC8537183.1 glycerol-3-phosphate acyltransferase [Feifania hominis]